MAIRKTQCGWMALGGCLCLFGLALVCKVRDGNRANAQAENPLVVPTVPIPTPGGAPSLAEETKKSGKTVEEIKPLVPGVEETKKPGKTVEENKPLPLSVPGAPAPASEAYTMPSLVPKKAEVSAPA